MSYWDRVLNRRVTRRRAIAATGALTASAVFLAACGGDDDDSGGSPSGNGSGSGGQPKAGGTLRQNPVAPNDPASLDPHRSPDAVTQWIIGPCYNQLLRFSEEELGRIDPDLAESYEASNDGLTLTFKLRDTKFHDGTPFTSEDVRVTMEKIKNPPPGIVSIRQVLFQPLDRVETPDARTAVFKLNRQSASFLGVLAITNIVIYAAKDILADPAFHNSNVNGTGPFIPGEIRRGSLYVLNKNPNYWDEGKPYIDRREWHIIPEAVGRLAAFTAGNLDLYRVEEDQLKAVESLSDVTVLQTAGTSFFRTTIAAFKEPWTDERTWKAFALALSKQDSNLANTNGLGTIGAMGMGSTQWSLSEKELLNVPGYKGLGDGKESDMETRRAEARKLLRAAGIEDGRRLTVFGLPTSRHAEVAADSLRKAGLDPQLDLVDRATYDQRLAAGAYGDFTANSGGAVFTDPTPVYADTHLTGGPRNYQKVSVPEADALYRRQEQELNMEKRIELAKEMQRVYLAKYPLEISPFTVSIEAFRNYVKGYTVLYGSIHQDRRGDNIWLDR